MIFKPVHDRVVVKQHTMDTVTAGGIVLADVAVQKPSEGTVLSCGPGKKNKAGILIPLEVAVGDRVLYYRQAGQQVKIEGEDVLILKEEEIYAVVEGDCEVG